MTTLSWALLSGYTLIIFILGMLIARKNPDFANFVARICTFGRDRASDIIKKARS